MAIEASAPRQDEDRRFREKVRPEGWRNPVPRDSYDLLVAGAGPAGLAAARAARGLGLTVALVEGRWVGGISLTTGSIPSKALVRTGGAFDAIVNSRRFRAPACGEPKADLALVMERVRAIRTRIAEYSSVERLTAAGIEVFFGDACFADSNRVLVGAASLQFKKAVIATGVRPRVPVIPGLAETGFLTSRTIFDIDTLPNRLAIIGGGPFGCEMAQAFAHLGSHVILLQNAPKFLPNEERDAAEILSLALSRSGVETWLNTTVVGACMHGGEKCIEAVNDGERYSIAADEILVTAGRVPNTEALSLHRAGIS